MGNIACSSQAHLRKVMEETEEPDISNIQCFEKEIEAKLAGYANKEDWMCSTPACWKPSWNRSPGEYCNRACRDGPQQAIDDGKRTSDASSAGLRTGRLRV